MSSIVESCGNFVRRCVLSVALSALFLAAQGAAAAGAGTTNTVLIDGISNAGAARDQTEAAALGFDVEVVTDAAVWNAKTTADFATYKAIALPDNFCWGPSATAIASRTTWAPAVTGNIIVVGGDPELHSGSQPGAAALVRNGIGFAANDPGKTGLWVALGCFATSAPVLDPFGAFDIQGQSSDSIHIVAVHPALTGLTDALLSNWGSSTHLKEVSYPSDFVPLAIQTNGTDPGVKSFADGSSGTVFLLVRGSGVQPVGLNISKSGPATANTGDNIVYTITYGNTGGTDATGVSISDPIPTGTTFVSATGGGTASGGTVAWAIGSLPHATTGLTTTFTVRVNASGTITNTGYQITDGTNTTTGADVTTAVTGPPTFLVSAAVSGTGGSLDPTTPSPASIVSGGTASFKFNADPVYHVASVSGCGGTPYTNNVAGLTTYTYATGPITAPCAVTATFAPDLVAPVPTLSMGMLFVFGALLAAFGALKLRA